GIDRGADEDHSWRGRRVRYLVDTNVISDIVTADAVWLEWSLAQVLHKGRELIVNPVIYAELCYRADSHSQVDHMLAELRVRFEEIPREALFLAAKAFLKYRERGGTKSSPLPDFFVGAHAQAVDIPLITRDLGRYRSYFPTVALVVP